MKRLFSKIDLNLISDKIESIDKVLMPSHVSKFVHEKVDDIKLIILKGGVDSVSNIFYSENPDKVNGFSCAKERLVFLANDSDYFTVYHEAYHILEHELDLKRDSEYAETFFREFIVMYEIDGRNRHLLKPSEFYAQSFAMYCSRPKFFRKMCPMTYNFFVRHKLICGDVLVISKRPNNFPRMLRIMSRDKINKELSEEYVSAFLFSNTEKDFYKTFLKGEERCTRILKREYKWYKEKGIYINE